MTGFEIDLKIIRLGKNKFEKTSEMMQGFCFVISAMVINAEDDDDTKLRVLKISVLTVDYLGLYCNMLRD